MSGVLSLPGTRVVDAPWGPIELTLPAAAPLVRIARLVASGVATAAEFDLDELEDLRIAVDEMCATLLEGGTGAPFTLRFEVSAGGVDVTGTTRAGASTQLDTERSALSRQILDAVVDLHTVDQTDHELRVQLQKRRTSAPA